MEDKFVGVSLYVPTTHRDLPLIANGEKLGRLRSVIFCTEDAVAQCDLADALSNLSMTLDSMAASRSRARFVRVRNPEVMSQVLSMKGSEKLAGFVVPKATRENFDSYFGLLKHTAHLVMPTLETAEVFDDWEMHQFRKSMSKPDVARRVLALRIGGNDLFALLGMRRPRDVTIYQTPLGPLIARLVTTFRPYGFRLTSPVFEHLDCNELLSAEVKQDLAYGMVGKTAIHPQQVSVIEQHYRVQVMDVDAARKILSSDSPAVFKMDNSMCEVATHRKWAQTIMEQAGHFGTVPV